MLFASCCDDIVAWGFRGHQEWVLGIFVLLKFDFFSFNTFHVSQIFRQRVEQATPKHSYCIFLTGLCWGSVCWVLYNTLWSMSLMISGYCFVPHCTIVTLLIEDWMSRNETVTEFLRFLLPSFLPHLWLCEIWWGGLVVVVESCGVTDSGPCSFSLSYPVFPLSLNIVNECYMNSLGPASCWKWTLQSVLRATTTTTTTTILHMAPYVEVSSKYK